MKKLKVSYARFATSDQIRTETFLSLLQGGANDKVFNDKFFDSIERRRSELAKLQQTITLLQVPIFAYLVLVLAGVTVNLSVLGIAAGANLREVLVVASAALGLWGTWASNEKDAIGSMLRARNYRAAKGNSEKLAFLDAGYGLKPLTVVNLPSKHWRPSGLHIVSAVVLVSAALALILFILVVLAIVHLFTLVEIYRHPNFSPSATIAVISFVILADLATAGWHFAVTGFLPYRDSERLMRLDKLRESDPVRYSAIIEDAVRTHQKKNPVWRLITRPKLPKDL